MILSKYWPILILLFCVSASCKAQDFGYAAGYDRLYRLNLVTAQATLIGAFGAVDGQAIVDMEGLAISPDGVLYGVSDALDYLFTINTQTGQASAVGSLGLQNQGTGSNGNLDYGLTFTCDGVLWLSSDTTGQLWQVNPQTGLAHFQSQSAEISGLAFRDGQLYGIAVGTAASAPLGLYQLTASGIPNVISILSHWLGSNLETRWAAGNPVDAGLDFDGKGRLWATLDYYPPSSLSVLAQLDPETGAILQSNIITGVGVSDTPDAREIEALAIAPAVCQEDIEEPPVDAEPPGSGGAALIGNAVPLNANWSLLTLFFSVLCITYLRQRIQK